MSYSHIASKNVFGFIPIERKQELEEVKEEKTCEYCRNITPIDISESIDWIKNSKQNFCKKEKNKKHQGPIIISNWLSDKLCVGGYPKNKFELDKILATGITTFVCLNQPFDKERIYKYEKDFPKDKNCLFINEPIEDMNITTDVKVRTL